MRKLLAVLAAGALAVSAPAAAFGDPGAPGTTFPEQPGTHGQTACAAVAKNIAKGAGLERSATATAIVTGLYIDACLGGP